MIRAVSFRISPNAHQKALLSQWMGAQRFIWNAKVSEEKYLRTYARKYLPVGTYPDFDQTYSQYKSKELCPWIFDIPCYLLRNACVRWYQTFRRFLKGECGRPRLKKKKDEGFVYITRELFSIERVGCRFSIRLGTKKHSIGSIVFTAHRSFENPASITIRKKAGNWYLSFCFGKEETPEREYQSSCLSLLRDHSAEDLESMVVGIDRGVTIPFQIGDEAFVPNEKSEYKNNCRQRYLKKQQNRLSRQVVGSKNRDRTKLKIAKTHLNIKNVREYFLQKSTFKICNDDHYKVFVLEDLKVRNLSRSPKTKFKSDGKTFARNGASAKAGLNRAILDRGWGRFETILKYKSRAFGKAWFKISPQYSSQECAACSAIHSGNRRTRDEFLCLSCNHRDHADRNAARVLKKRAIRLILDPGTGLSDRGVLSSVSDKGRGAGGKTLKAKADKATSIETSKKKKRCPKVIPLDIVLEASSF